MIVAKSRISLFPILFNNYKTDAIFLKVRSESICIFKDGTITVRFNKSRKSLNEKNKKRTPK